jgi:tetratricopeptide (TPR) repeat protein
MRNIERIIFARLAGFAWKPRSPLAAATAALERGDVAGALAFAERALAQADTPAAHAAAHNKRGVVLVRGGDRDAAVFAFLAALEAEPRHVPAIVNVGNLLLESGMTADAIEHYEAALRLDDRYAPAYQNLGVALRRLGRLAESVRALRAAGRVAGRLNLRRKTTEA